MEELSTLSTGAVGGAREAEQFWGQGMPGRVGGSHPTPPPLPWTQAPGSQPL